MVLAKRLIAAVAAFAAFALSPADAQTLRWASQGDPQTMDPHSQNESMTNMMNGQVYEKLTTRDRSLAIKPSLATEWQQVSPLLWRFKLRPNVKFHDGAPFGADDVVFSINRAKEPTSGIAAYATMLGDPRKIDNLTVEFHLQSVNPIFLQHLDSIFILNKAWAEKYRVTKPLDFKNKEESHASLNANGTGPYQLISRAPGVKTVYKRNPNWWGKFEGNVQDVVFTPISNDATRVSALLSGDIDFVLDPAPRDLPRLRNTSGIKILEGPENRVIFIGMDQGRDKLLYGNVAGDKNPFKDLRVRQALYQAVDIETMKTKLMNNQAIPTGALTPSPLAYYNDPQFEKRLPFDIARARTLMAEAGYADGFEVTLDCPNNRYINDEEICIALASMWAQLKVKVKVNAMPRATYFAKMDKTDTSMYMLGWGGSVTDAETTLTPVMRNRADKGVGFYNYGSVKNDKFDAMAAASSSEADPRKREDLVKSALREYSSQVHLIPLHRQIIAWAARNSVEATHRSDNWLELSWVTVR
jgi:peptide/nickel transport system substrate-binding protein